MVSDAHNRYQNASIHRMKAPLSKNPMVKKAEGRMNGTLNRHDWRSSRSEGNLLCKRRSLTDVRSFRFVPLTEVGRYADNAPQIGGQQ